MRVAKNRQAGYSFVEVLTAFAILSFAIAAILPIYSNSLRAANTVETRTLARLHLESLLSEIGVSQPLAAGAYAGALDNGMNWEIAVTPQRAARNFTLYRIDASISWRARGASTDRLRVETMRIGPTDIAEASDAQDTR